MSGSDPTNTYKVGKNRPPIERRFKPGESGNPKGRRKGVRNFKTVFAEVMAAPLTITDKGGRKRRVTALEALLKRTMRDALEGKSKQIALMFNLILASEKSGGPPTAEKPTTEEDKAILRRALRRIAREENDE